MESWTGELAFRDLGAGLWTLRTDDGKVYQLAGAVPGDLAGQRVTVRGTHVDLHGFGMVGAGGIEVAHVAPEEG
jgi:hypothetical protein